MAASLSLSQVCPLCAANLGKDAAEHFMVQHASSLKVLLPVLDLRGLKFSICMISLSIFKCFEIQ